MVVAKVNIIKDTLDSRCFFFFTSAYTLSLRRVYILMRGKSRVKSLSFVVQRRQFVRRA